MAASVHVLAVMLGTVAFGFIITSHAQGYNNQGNGIQYNNGVNGFQETYSHQVNSINEALEKYKDGVVDDPSGLGSTPVEDYRQWLLVKAREHAKGNVMVIPDGADGFADTPLGNISQQCYDDVMTFFTDLEATPTPVYADKMRISWGENMEWIKVAFRYSAQSFGQFELCKGIYKGDRDNAPFDTEYCVMYHPIVRVAGIRAEIGSCWPSSCSSRDLEVAHKTYLRFTGAFADITYDCIIRETWSGGAIATLCMLAVFAVAVATGSIYHVSLHENIALSLTKSRDAASRKSATDNTYEQTVEDEKPRDKEPIYEIPAKGNGSTVVVGEEGVEETDLQKADLQSESNNNAEDPGKANGMTKLVIDDERDLQTKQAVTRKNTRLAFIDSILMAFSAFRNTEKIFTVGSSSSMLGALNGIRVLSMWWVILGHSNQFLLWPQRYDNVPYGIEISEKTASQAIFNATYSVDTFFVLSGFLVTYLTLKELARTNGHVNWVLFYVHRYLRITPLLMVVVAIVATLGDHVAEGPGKNEFFDSLEDQCSLYWWTHPLYINNLYPFPGNEGTQVCVGWAWYLANDMQFYIISPVIIYILYKKWKWGMALIVSLCLVSFGSIAYINWYWGLGVGGTGNYNNRTDVDPTVTAGDAFTYTKPYTRINTYLVGMTLGLIMYKINGKRFKMNSLVIVIGWVLAIAIGSAVIYGIQATYNGPRTPQWLAITYQTLSRFAFAIAVSWVIFVCITGNGGYVNSFLSWDVWAPLAKLSFAAYMVHPIFIMVVIHNSKTTFHWTYFTCSYWFIANVVVSYATGYLISILVEGPFAGLEKVLIGSRKPTSVVKKDN